MYTHILAVVCWFATFCDGRRRSVTFARVFGDLTTAGGDYRAANLCSAETYTILNNTSINNTVITIMIIIII